MARDIYLVGSVPMASARDVFEEVSATLGARIKRLPDGETGKRADWIIWLEPIFSEHPAFQKSGEFFRVHAAVPDASATRLSQASHRATCISRIYFTPTSPNNRMPSSSV